MLTLGIDLGTSSVKVSVIDTQTNQLISAASYPESESPIISSHKGWAEQDPDTWWHDVKMAILKCNSLLKYNSKEIKSIGIAYQMHGLVVIDKFQKVLRPSIIWCDSRAVEIGNNAFNSIGQQKCLDHLLNSPGNFTASKLAWVKQNEPSVYNQIYKVLLPGDFISMKLTGQVSTSIEALSEGTFWDFKEKKLSDDVLNYYQFNSDLFPEIKEVFSNHGYIDKQVASELSLNEDVTITYKAGDQPNNALSLNVLNPGEIAATAGTSGVIYGVSEKLSSDSLSRINTFAHVNYTEDVDRLGVLLCINGVGILNKWIKNITGNNIDYEKMNAMITGVPAGAEGLRVLPFGNGAERMLGNKIVGAHISNIDLNKHSQPHLYRACQEGIAFAFRYGLDIMRDNGINPSVIRVGNANLFKSEPFVQAFANATNTSVQIFETDGSIGAAKGAAIGNGLYKTPKEAFSNNKPTQTIHPQEKNEYETFYNNWKEYLNQKLDLL